MLLINILLPVIDNNNHLDRGKRTARREAKKEVKNIYQLQRAHKQKKISPGAHS
jgi:hypothetical protein